MAAMSEETMRAEEGVADEQIRKILAELQRRFRIAGRGTVSRVEKELDLGTGYFKDQRRPGRKRFDLKILFRALDALDVEPAEFFASVLGAVDPVASFKSEAALLRRRQRLPRIVAAVAERPADEAEEVVLEPAELGELDGLRRQDPGLAMRRVRALVGRVVASQVPLLLGIYASASRGLGHCDRAQMVLARALELAEERRDLDACGDLLLRAGQVAASREQLETAHALAERASLMFARSGNLVGIGRSLVDQGTWLGSLDRPHEARRALRSALAYFSEEAGAEVEPAPAVQRNRFSCLMSLGLLHRGQGDLEAARRRLAEASDHSRGVGDSLVGRLLALQASVECQAGDHSRAEELFRQAFRLLRPVDPLSAALCGVELARVLLQQSKTAAAYDTAKAMLPLLEPLEKNPAASAALGELLRRALPGPQQTGRGLSLALLRRVARGLEEGRRRSLGATAAAGQCGSRAA